MEKATNNQWDLHTHYQNQVKPALSKTPWILRITEHSDKPVPVLIIKEYIRPNSDQNSTYITKTLGVLEDRGLIYGQSLRRCLPVFREILRRVNNEEGVPLELEQFFKNERITFRGNLPVSDEAGYKLGLIFKLQERIQDLDRVELVARRIERFTREEAAYWFSRITNFGEEANRWARAGMRLMLGGQPGDPAIEPMLDELRSSQ
jgi:hypothetical protein